jgi:hypothetical protein
MPHITKASREIKLTDVRLNTRSTTLAKTREKFVDNQNLLYV